MSGNNDFLSRLTNVRDASVEKGIQSGNPYTICDLLEQTKGGIYLRELENAIMETKDIVQIYEFLFLAVDMNIAGFNRERFERVVRESGNSKLMRYCMGFVPGTNLEAMSHSLEQTQNAKDMEILKTDEEYSDVFEMVKQIDPEYEEKIEVAKEFDYYPDSLKQFRGLKDNVEALKEEVKATKNPHFITELANYLEYLNEYKGQSYDINDLTIAQEKTQDPMQAYEYLASVNVENKKGLIQSVINSGRTKFIYYVYQYVPGLTEQEKEILKENIMKKSSDEKYKIMLEAEGDLEKNAGEMHEYHEHD